MKISIIETGKFKLDGGAMFGVVPKRMWEKLNPADNDNMCTWSMRCLLIESGNQKILIDTGVGFKQDERFRKHFFPHDDLPFKDLLAPLGLTTEDITDIFLTHFHFDHVGGAVSFDKAGNLIPTFPNATYWANEQHYQWAYNPNAREQASFLKENFVPLKDWGKLKFIDVEQDISFNEFINVRFVYGHTGAMMVPFIKLPSGNTLVYTADLIPSHHHMPMPYIMAYDVQPLETLKEKETLYEQILDGKHFLFFEHDLNVACGFAVKNESGRVIFGGETQLHSII
ncbi:MAG: MBL fold metallo-hydrolase [Saprospiraceae bacterium]|nr:MBL fold metallo-hydrolase [Saprospiraceae bacterium]